MKKLGIVFIGLFILLVLGVGAMYFFVDPTWYDSMPHVSYYGGWHMGSVYPFFMMRGLLMVGLFIGFMSMVYLFFLKEQKPLNHQTSLDLRLAKGDITLEEYKNIKAELRKEQ